MPIFSSWVEIGGHFKSLFPHPDKMPNISSSLKDRFIVTQWGYILHGGADMIAFTDRGIQLGIFTSPWTRKQRTVMRSGVSLKLSSSSSMMPPHPFTNWASYPIQKVLNPQNSATSQDQAQEPVGTFCIWSLSKILKAFYKWNGIWHLESKTVWRLHRADNHTESCPCLSPSACLPVLV